MSAPGLRETVIDLIDTLADDAQILEAIAPDISLFSTRALVEQRANDLRERLKKYRAQLEVQDRNGRTNT